MGQGTHQPSLVWPRLLWGLGTESQFYQPASGCKTSLIFSLHDLTRVHIVRPTSFGAVWWVDPSAGDGFTGKIPGDTCAGLGLDRQASSSRRASHLQTKPQPSPISLPAIPVKLTLVIGLLVSTSLSHPSLVIMLMTFPMLWPALVAGPSASW